ncbi:hypothetical protein NEILACOT_03153 [Neisseria lactamica ATCC 23970]|uniref:Uncharacterized protein n=2 Tax=Neisseria lactamica TaxID=486 RepID=D0W6L5_NEILA|nr:hypothetical protein NEILACOT_03153 [Neisseria lactamica ATCC 23970]
MSRCAGRAPAARRLFPATMPSEGFRRHFFQGAAAKRQDWVWILGCFHLAAREIAACFRSGGNRFYRIKDILSG